MATEDDREQADLGEFRAGMTTESVTRMLVIPLQSSVRKREKVKTAVNEYGEFTSWFADALVSFPTHERSRSNPSLYRLLKKQFPRDECETVAKVAQSAIADVVDSYDAWRANGGEGERPSFDQVNYFAVTNQELTLKRNEDSSFGLKVSFIPYNPEWFRLYDRQYHREYLNCVVDDEADARLGSTEIHLDEDGLRAHLPITYDVEVYDPGDVSTTVGVDLGESTLYAAAVVDEGEVQQVEMESGAEFRHHRDRLERKRRQLSEQGDLDGVRACRGDRERYTEQVCHTASKAIVDLASSHAPAKIHLEDLTHYRRTADDPIHDWPFAELQEQIMYKARAAGIPAMKVDPRNTSVTCRKCGQTTPEFRDGDEFTCRRCGYEVHADVNAAINIAEDR